MFRKQISKYKNVAPKLIKKEQILNGVSTNRLSNTIGSLINCSLNHITFAIDHASSGSVCTIRHDDLPKKQTFSNDVQCTTHCHSGPITDIQYNPFNESVMATCAYDCQIKLWSVQEEEGVQVSHLSSLNLNENRSDCIQWNPNVDNMMVSTSLNTIYLWDIETQKNISALRNHNDAIQSLSWKRDGSLLCTTSKDKTMQIVDPRNKNTDSNLLIEGSKTANKDSKVVWIGSSDCILSSNYNSSFQREVVLWDIRNTSEPVHDTDVGTGNNVLVPYYDYDASVLYLIGKAETVVRCGEVFTEKNWNFTLNTAQQVDDQIKSACMLPKFGVDLMKCELDRLILLTRNSVYPLPYYVPRRSYFEFHADAYPLSYNTSMPGLDKASWLEGENKDPVRVSLNLETQKNFLGNKPIESVEAPTPKPEPVSAPTPAPVSTPTPAPVLTLAPTPVSTPSQYSGFCVSPDPVTVEKPTVGVEVPSEKVSVSAFVSSFNKTATNDSPAVSKQTSEKEFIKPDEVKAVTNSEPLTPVVFRSTKTEATNGHTNGHSNGISNGKSNGTHGTSGLRYNSSSVGDRRTKVKSVYYQSKYKYIDGKPAHKSENISNIRNLSTMWPSECDGFHVNTKHAAFLVGGSSGQVGIVELDKPGRLSDSNVCSLVNKSKISDFQWNPYNDEQIAVACDDGIIKIWNIPENGLESSLEEPNIELRGHVERLYCIKYHPYVKDVLASASYDRTVKIWNIDTQQAVKTLKGHENVIFSMNWSPCGTKLATICKDSVIRVYEPLVSETPVAEQKLESGCGPYAGSKAARIEWVSGGSRLLVSGFERGNQRQIYLYDAENLIFLTMEDINQSPSLLIPYHDHDTNVLYLYAKGEESVYLYEILESEPYFQVLTPYKPDGLHFAMSFLPKISCDVKVAEINRAFRLTKSNCIERISFTVPRVKLGFFQDDIFPETINLESPYLTADEWFNGTEIMLKYIDLQPENMQKLTEMLAAQEANKPQKPKKSTLQVFEKEKEKASGTLYNPDNLTGDEQKIISSMLHRASLFYKEKSDAEDDSDWQ